MGQSVTRGPVAPESAKSEGAINQAGVTSEMRHPSTARPLSDGPRRGEREEFLPAAYEIVHNIPMPDGSEKTIKMIREDH